MSGPNDPCSYPIRECMPPDQLGEPVVQAVYVRDAATQNNHIGIQYVYERRQTSREPVLVRGERSNRARLASFLSGRNLLRRKFFLGERKILSRQAGSRKERFYTAVFSAVTPVTWALVFCSPLLVVASLARTTILVLLPAPKRSEMLASLHRLGLTSLPAQFGQSGKAKSDRKPGVAPKKEGS